MDFKSIIEVVGHYHDEVARLVDLLYDFMQVFKPKPPATLSNVLAEGEKKSEDPYKVNLRPPHLHSLNHQSSSLTMSALQQLRGACTISCFVLCGTS